ncbi:type II toxin-antitoxin system VapC family toxin [Sphingomonas sp. CJ20]
MTWFVDASAIVALVGREDDWQHFADRLDQDSDRLWSPVCQWESAVALARRLGTSPVKAREIVADFADTNRFDLVPIGARESALALDSWHRFGKRSGHPAALNMGDCFAYACTKAHGAKLLYKGDDFSHTDLA